MDQRVARGNDPGLPMESPALHAIFLGKGKINTTADTIPTGAAAFATGNFSTPAFVHLQEVPGAKVMAARRDLITYTYRDLPRGGVIRIATTDAEAIHAIHEFLAFQRLEHKTK